MHLRLFSMHRTILEKNMKRTRASGAISLIALTLMVSPFAIADDSSWYIGGNVGQSKAKIDDPRITNSLLVSGFSTTNITDDNRDTGYKLFAGHRFNNYFAVEGGYFNLGNFGFTSTTAPAGSLHGNVQIQGENLDLVGTLPITEKFSAIARVGFIYADARDSFTGSGLVHVLNANPSKSEANYKAGLGLQYAVNDSVGLRLEAERYRINDGIGNQGDIDLISVGLVYRFGAKKPAPTPAPAPRAAEPVPVVIASAPPEPAVVIPPPAPKRVTFTADSLFGFDKSTVKPEGKAALNKLAAELKGTKYSTITVTGHTDRIGTHAYNMKLSTRRAEAVKAYLVGSTAIPAAKITAKGTDGTDPITKPGECVGTKATKKLIACLQPDRRVEVDVSGTK